ncbi:MAG: translation initiation factor IF-2 [Candidatus Marsarchaeota archaeon]|nr:translation initiation factor IF-2 [Candidatus Marsarchaeota archaeon]
MLAVIRQPIIVVMGHVDHGKTTLLDRIRSTAITAKEAGGITQHIGASEVPLDVIKKTCGRLLERLKANITIPGLLFIDTPGHEAFTNLRKRGGSVADLAILVVDVTKNFEPQTLEAIEILKEYRTPFIVAANKIDVITGWRSTGLSGFAEAISGQSSSVVEDLEARVYALIGALSGVGFNSERFDRVKDFKKEVLICPISAKTGEGIAELLMYATGLSQRFLEDRLEIEVNGAGVGGIIERKEEKGLGTTIDVILYNGSLKVNDTIAFAAPNRVSTSKIKALLKPKPLQELRESSSKFYYVDSVSAAAGIKISGSGLEEALPGSLVISTDYQNYEKEIRSELQEVFEVDKSGVILKSDSIGGIEGLSKLLKGAGMSISKKGIGKVTKRDVLDAFSIRATDPESAVVVAFNVAVEQEAEQEAYATGVNIIGGNIIYKIVDDYKAWLDEERKKGRQALEKALVFPGAVRTLRNSCFRVSHPAIFGIEVVAGRIRPGVQLMNRFGDVLGTVKEMQDNGISLQEAKKGDSLAMSMDGVTYGRQLQQDEDLYVFLNDDDERALRYKFSGLLSEGEVDVLDEISRIKAQKRKG